MYTYGHAPYASRPYGGRVSTSSPAPSAPFVYVFIKNGKAYVKQVRAKATLIRQTSTCLENYL